LLYQACLLSKDISVFNEALKAQVLDPHQLLQALTFLNPSFWASDTQIASLCAGFSWFSSDLLLEDPQDYGYELCKVPGSVDGPFHIFVKGTDIDITGKKSLEWSITADDQVVSKTTLEIASTAEASSSSLNALKINIVTEKSTAVSSSSSSLSLRDSLISMLFGPVSSLLKDKPDQLSNFWSLLSE
ncbi:hypothetical protein Moror_15810, partial [Moniliophthora roreri MCA 2997]